MNDFVTHIDSYIAYASSSAASSTLSSFSSVSSETESATSATRSSRSQGSTDKDREKDKNEKEMDKDKEKDAAHQEPLSWSSVGGYDHPQPGSRLLQYGKYVCVMRRLDIKWRLYAYVCT